MNRSLALVSLWPRQEKTRTMTGAMLATLDCLHTCLPAWRYIPAGAAAAEIKFFFSCWPVGACDWLNWVLPWFDFCCCLVPQWVPAHCGLPGDEKVDELATLGAKGRQQDNSVIFQEKKILIRETQGQCTERDDSTSSTSHSRLSDYAWATTDTTPTYTGK